MTIAFGTRKLAGIAHAPAADRFCAPFVGLVWLAMSIGALRFVTVYGSPYVPWSDDWDGIVPYYTGERPITWDWLWSAHNEHRLVLPRLALLAVLTLSGGDLEAVMFLNVVLLAAIALGMIRAACVIRGRTSYTDALFPLVVLNLSQFENLLNAWQLQMIMSVSLAGVLLCLIAARPVSWSPGAALIAGVCLLSLPVCGINGLVLALPLALWFVFASLQGRRSIPTYGGWTRGVLLCAAVGCLGLVGAYFVGYERPLWPPPHTPTFGQCALAALQTLGLAVGVEAASSLWPSVACGLLALVIVTSFTLLRRFWSMPQDRARISGILVCLLSTVTLAFGIGWNRVGLGHPFPLVSRYVTLVAPILCILHLSWGIFGGTAAARVQWGLFLLVWATLWTNVRESNAGAWSQIRQSTLEFEKALGERLSIPALAKRHPFSAWNTWSRDQLELRLRGLHAGGFAPYHLLSEHLPPLQIGARIDLTTSPPEFLLLRVGWHEPEHSFRRTTAHAELRFWLDPIQPLRFRMSAIPLQKQVLIIGLNGVELTTLIQCDTQAGVIDVELPTSALRQDNFLTLSLFDATIFTSAETSNENRGLGVGWVEFTR